MGIPADRIEALPESPATDVPRFMIVARGGRAGRTEGLDVPADADGVKRMVEWLAEHAGWAIVTAEVKT